MKYKTDRQVIMETYNYYGVDPVGRRSVYINDYGAVKCAYNSDKGHCAVGRCLKAEYRNQGFDLESNVDGINDFERNQGKSIQDMVKPSYSMISDNLWVALQEFHDNSDNWWFGEGAPEYQAFSEDPERSGQFKYLTVIGEEKLGRMLETAKYNENNEDRKDYH
jgi:hypothetical protein